MIVAIAASVVFPLTGPADASSELTDALARSISASISPVSIEDAAGLLDCDPETTSCLASVAKQTKAERLVFGTVEKQPGGKLKVVLTRFDLGPDREQRTFVVANASELVEASGKMFGREDRPVVVREEPDPKPIVEPQPRPRPRPRPHRDDDEEAGITNGTWALLGVGVIVAGVGVGFHVAARNIAAEYNTAPNETRADIDHLLDLEDRGHRDQTLGWVFVGTGAALALIATTRAAVQSVSVSPTNSGAVVAVTRRF